MSEERYILQPSSSMEDGFVLTDTELGIVITFVKGRFNDTQKVTLLEDVTAPDPLTYARAMGAMTDWLVANYPHLVSEEDNKLSRKQFRVSVGESLKNARIAKGWSLRELSLRSGINYSNLCRIESGRLNFTADTLSQICDVLGIKVVISNCD